ncbi:MAG: hypothetical protein JO077_08355 [Verrucomicrobia bacterium]|nr:hypothetical protein [Verrucomicrobiota bacterium]
MSIKKTNLAVVEEAENADSNGPEIVQSREDDSQIRKRGTFGKVDYGLLKKKAHFDREPISEATQQVLSTATTPTVLRPLGSLEEFLWLIDQHRPVHFALAAQVQGATTVGGWRDALDLVQLRHPLLSVCIEANGDCRPRFRREAAPISLRVVQEDNVVQRWESEIELELSIPFDARQAPLVRAVLLHEADQAVFILVAHHSVADGVSIAFVIRDVLQVLSRNPIGLLPPLPAHEEILGVTLADMVQAKPSRESNSPPPGRPATYLRKEDLRTSIKALRLTPKLTGKLRERARQEGTTVHGALSSAAALAYWQNNPELKEESIRIWSPTDTRKLLGLGEHCAVLISGQVVAIEPQASTPFWDIARQAMPGRAGAQTLKGIIASRCALHRIVKNGIDVPTAAAVCAQTFAHEIRLSNLGNLPYGTEFGDLKLQALWGPSVSARFQGALNIGVATTNGALCLLETKVGSSASLLETAEQILLSACAA